MLIRRVEDSDGKVLYQDAGKSQRAVSEATAFLMSSMLADVINAGTAYKARQSGFTLPAAGKTGTTNDYVDAWFVGFTPHLVTGVWVGFDQPKTIVAERLRRRPRGADLGRVHEDGDQGGQARLVRRPGERRRRQRVPRVGQAAQRRLRHRAVGDRRWRSSRRKSMIYTDYFVKGTQPTTICPLHPGGILGRRRDARRFPRRCRHAGVAPPSPRSAPSTGGVVAGADDGGDKDKDEPAKKKGFWGRIFGKKDAKDEGQEARDRPKAERARVIH